jgi:hypothetical protein
MSVMELAEHIARRKRKLDADPQAAEVVLPPDARERERAQMAEAKRKLNQRTQAEEDVECADMVLDEIGVPTNRKEGRFSLVGPIKALAAALKAQIR